MIGNVTYQFNIRVMKSISCILPVLAIFFFLSCKTQPDGPEGTAMVKGQVNLLDADSGYMPPYNAIQVSLEGTNYSTVTDDSGLFELDGIPQGTYDVRFSKAGYGDVRWIGTSIQGGGNSPIYLNEQSNNPSSRALTLYKQSDLITTLTSASIKDSALPTNSGIYAPYVWLEGQYSCSHSLSTNRYQIAVYFSHQSSVSAEPGHYDWFECWGTGGWWPWNTATLSYNLPIVLGDLQSVGFNSGDSVYVACYGAPNYGFYPPYDYYDPSTRKFVLTALNQTPSPVIGFKIP
jgi:hypothetical protein